MIKEPSRELIPGGRSVLNDGFGNRCVICGSCFDEGGICNNGHVQGKTYYYPPEKELKSEKPVAVRKQTFVTCEVFGGHHCSICSGIFPDGDDICVNGHQIGKQYPTE